MKIKRIIFSLTLVIAILLSGTATQRIPAQSNDEYEIYPNPQEISYSSERVTITPEVNLIVDSGIDSATLLHIKNVLSNKGIVASISTEVHPSNLNILLGIKDSSNVLISNAASSAGIIVKEGFFDKTDAYQLSIKKNTVLIVGKDSDAAFYGVTTFKHILSQVDRELSALDIYDYSNSQWRGVIEGFYGIPWSFEDRISLMQFGSDFKMNSFIFAPKDDPYHNLNWRDLYPEAELTKVKTLADAGAATKMNFIWSIHPFKNNAIDFSTEEAYQSDLNAITNKFEQLYSIGVRQFGVMADDSRNEGKASAENTVRLMNDVNAWVNAKPDVYSLVMVPKVYSEALYGYSQYLGFQADYLEVLGNLDTDIEVMWTGSATCGYVSESTFNFFTNITGKLANPGRTPLMWLNWPVNDFVATRLLMGKAEMLDTSVTNFRGIVTNPMQQSESSKIAIFAIADYTWNIANFNKDKNWVDSFKYVEPNASGSLYELAKHLSDPDSSGWIELHFDESEEIRPFIESFIQSIESGSVDQQKGVALTKELQKIVDASISFERDSKNERLKFEVRPWRQSLETLSNASITYINGLLAQSSKDVKAMLSSLKAARNLHLESKQFEVQNLVNNELVQQNVLAGTKRLQPLAETLNSTLTIETAKTIVDDGAKYYTVDSINALKEELTKTLAILNNADATPEEKTQALDDLFSSMNQLVEVIRGIEDTYTMELNETISIHPEPIKGTWTWDATYLNLTSKKVAALTTLETNGELQVTALKVGSTELTYTAENGQIKTTKITIKKQITGKEENTSKPSISTGDTTNIYLLGMIMLVASGIGIYCIRLRKKR